MNKTFDLFETTESGFSDSSQATKTAINKSSERKNKKREDQYTAKDIEVLEGLEPVRKRPGMYIGGTDNQALHHLFFEVLDNAMDEVIAGYASKIDVTLNGDGSLSIRDDGRGIPIDPHPKFKDKSALEVIFTTLHSGGKFGGKAYNTSGGLHGVGISVVNALSERCEVEVARDDKVWCIVFSKGVLLEKLQPRDKKRGERGTKVTFYPDSNIFGKNNNFSPQIILKTLQDKAYLFQGVKIQWACDKSILKKHAHHNLDERALFCFPEGLKNYLQDTLKSKEVITDNFLGNVSLAENTGKIEWAMAWTAEEQVSFKSFCNTISTPLGGTHETGLRTALLKGLKAYGELTSNKKSRQITSEDLMSGTVAILSLFINEPEFQGQTKEKLTSTKASKIVEKSVRDHFDHWLSADPDSANLLLENIINLSEERLKRRREKEVSRKRATRKLRLPGKLADCTQEHSAGSELFIVEGDSAGGSAKQARVRQTQAVLPLRGKILNVASASSEKLKNNQELSDLIQALGCGIGSSYNENNLRYERIIIMTDADVDGAHIAALLMTFFYREMPQLIAQGHLYIAQPPLYRLSVGDKTIYAMDDNHKDLILSKEFSGKRKVEVSRFKGLGEMPASQLKETTMDPSLRNLLRVEIPPDEEKNTASRVEELMGRKPELRLNYIQSNANFVKDGALDI